MNTIQKARPEWELARRAGEPRFFTGRPCLRGHVAQRFTASGGCCVCRAEDRKRLQSETNKYQRERRRVIASNPVKAETFYAAERARSGQKRAKNPERINALQKVYREREKASHPARYRARKNAKAIARELAKDRRTPSWADLKAIRAFYEACPEGHEVDHIEPLRGRLVSGLHVLANLQYLPRDANRAKAAKFEPYALSERL